MASLADRPTTPAPPWTRVSESQTVALHAVAVHEQGRVTVVVHGELDLGSAPALQREVHALLALPIEAIVLDLAGLAFADSSGIRALNDLRNAASEHRIPFSLGPVSEPVRRMLEMTGMTALFAPPG